MINSEIAKRIRNYLFQNKELRLPGVGTFKVHHIDQYLNSNDTIIHPPFLKIRFQQENHNDDIHQTLKVYHPDKKLQDELKSYFQEVINDVLNFGEGVIAGLGVLKQNSGGDIYFTPYDLLDIENQYLPIVDTLPFGEKPIGKMETVILEKSKVFVPILKKSEESIESVSSQKANPDNTQVNVKLEESVKNDMQLPNPKVKIDHEARYPAYALAGMALLAGSFFIVKQCFYSPSPQKEPVELGFIESHKSNSIENVDEGRSGASSDQEYQFASVASTNCIVILGSFKTDKGAYTLENVLRKDGHDTIIQDHNGYRRVGIEFDCDPNADLTSHLNSIREKYKVDAWYLEPAQEVL